MVVRYILFCWSNGCIMTPEPLLGLARRVVLSPLARLCDVDITYDGSQTAVQSCVS